MAFQPLCPFLQMPTEIIQQILLDVLISLHFTEGSVPPRPQYATSIHAATRAPDRYWTFATSQKRVWSYKYLAGDLRVLRTMLGLKLVSVQFYHAVLSALLEGQRMGITWHWATCDWSTKAAPGKTFKPCGPCKVHGESNINKHVLDRRDWPEIDETAVRIAKETGAGYCATIDALCRLISDAEAMTARHYWLKLRRTRRRSPGLLMPDGVRWLDPDGHSVSYDHLRSPVPESWLLGITLLSAAAYWNLVPLAERLLGAGFDPTADYDVLPPAMMLAAWAGHAEMLRLFQQQLPQARRRSRGVNYLRMGWVGKADTTAIVGAAARGDVEMLKLAIFPPSGEDGDQGPIVSGPCGTSWRNQTFLGQALEVALEYTTDWPAYLFMARFFDPASYLGDFFKASQRITARHFLKFARDGNPTMVRHLLDAGARATGWCGVLGLTVRRRHAEVVDLLLAAGMDPNRPGERSQAALVLAANNGDVRIARALLAHGAVVSRWAVLGALRAPSPHLVELLLADYAGDYIGDLTGARELMLEEGRGPMARLLREAGVPPWCGPEPGWFTSH